MAVVKLSISMDETILQMLDAYADAEHMTRSGAIKKAIGLALEQYEAKEALSQAKELADAIADEKYITDEAARKYKKLLTQIEEIVRSPF